MVAMVYKRLLAILLTAAIVGGLTLACSAEFAGAQTGTSVSGIISQDTTWTKANSPYSLTGPVAVNVGVNLRIEPGVTINLNGYYIQVNGTLTAKGSSTNLINFNGGSIVFTV
ncbi:MAG TPA: hypothetical protein VMD05_07795, partial [Candidatus Nanoarchaeia archaeon]|nr:hypothetical protein [Candidatus Nanoarchaeia archaeon]